MAHLATFNHRRRNDFQSGGGARFFEVKNGASAPAVVLARRRGVSEGGCAPLRSWSFFENVGSNEVIWCTIFHHVKQLTACLLRYFFTLEQDGQKSGGARPPSLKSGGATGPPGPPPPVPPPMHLTKEAENAQISINLEV